MSDDFILFRPDVHGTPPRQAERPPSAPPEEEAAPFVLFDPSKHQALPEPPRRRQAQTSQRCSWCDGVTPHAPEECPALHPSDPVLQAAVEELDLEVIPVAPVEGWRCPHGCAGTPLDGGWVHDWNCGYWREEGKGKSPF